jgi:L-seryl-tRNA(Ser) seleniumtransferase
LSRGTSAVGALPYKRGELLRSTDDDVRKLRAAWRIVERRHRDGSLFDFSGLERSLDVGDVPPASLHDDLAPALVGERLTELALEHLGGEAGRDDVFVANRLTAAAVAAMQVLVGPGARVVGVSPSYTHPAVVRGVHLAGGEFVDGGPITGADLVVLTRLAVTYETLPLDALVEAVAEAQRHGVPVFVDDAGGARVGPAVLGQPKTLELGAEVGATGLDKYGTTGPRLGLLAGRAELVGRIRARAIELGLEARPMLYPAVVRSLEQYRPERVRELVAATTALGDALEERLGGGVDRTPVAVKLEGEQILAEAAARAGIQVTTCYLVPYEATAALAMLLLRDHGIFTVHFAALPPGTSALLLKFVVPETLERFGGPGRFAAAVDESLDALSGLVTDVTALRALVVASDPFPTA